MLRSRIRLAAVLAAVALVLAGCGGDDEPSGGSSAAPGELKVFAAASLTAAFTEIGEQFTAANGGTKVTFNFAGSQALATQIQQAAPADVFASADTTNMDKVKDLVGTPQPFASNLLAIVVEKGNPKGVQALDDLANDRPEGGPGRPGGAGRQVRQPSPRPRPRSPSSRCRRRTTSRPWSPRSPWARPTPGIVYVTDVTAGGDKVEGVDIPEDQNVLATYPIATVKASQAQDQAQAFMDLVLSGEGQQVLKEHGFLPPPTT